MMRWRPRRSRLLALAALLAAAVLLVLPTASVAASPVPASVPGGIPDPTGGGTGHWHHHRGVGLPPVTAPPATAPFPGKGAPIGDDPGGLDDNTLANGGGDPLCKNLAALSADARQNCHLWDPASNSVASSGTPESLYPIGNYGLDQHINTGLTDVGNDIASAMQTLIGAMFGLVTRLVSLAILAISLAFSFSLWRSDQTNQIPTALTHIEQLFTSPLLQIAILVGGAVALSLVIMGRHGRALGGIVAMCVMVIATLLVMQNPRGTLGWFDSVTNNAAQFSVGAVAGHPSATAPTSSYANATENLWQGVGEEPWCDMEFGDVGWCMTPVSKAPRLVNYVNTTVIPHLRSGDNRYGDHGHEPQAQQDREIALLQACLGRESSQTAPCTIGQLWLAFPPGDDARNGTNDKWTLYHWLNVNAPSMAGIRGAGGVGQRLTALFLTTVAMFFFLLLLLYIAINLLLAGIMFVILLLLAGAMALVACFGEWGREKWTQWGLMLLGTLAVRLLFAVYLGIMILASTMMRDVGATMGGWLVQWLLYAIFWWQAWTHRNRLMELFTGRQTHTFHHPGLTPAAAALPAYEGARLGARAAKGSGRIASNGGRRVIERRLDAREQRVEVDKRNELESERRERTAPSRQRGAAGDHHLTGRAQQLLDARYTAARATLDKGEARQARADELQEQGTRLRRERGAGRGRGAARREPPAATPREQDAFMQAERIRDGLRDDPEYQQAHRFVSDADERQDKTGHRYSDGQIMDARSAVERELEADPGRRDYQQAAYRLGPDGHAQWERTTEGSPERERLKARIDQQIEQDRQAHRSTQRTPVRPDSQGPRSGSPSQTGSASQAGSPSRAGSPRQPALRQQPAAPPRQPASPQHQPLLPAHRVPRRQRRPGELLGVERNTRRPE